MPGLTDFNYFNWVISMYGYHCQVPYKGRRTGSNGDVGTVADTPDNGGSPAADGLFVNVVTQRKLSLSLEGSHCTPAGTEISSLPS